MQQGYYIWRVRGLAFDQLRPSSWFCQPQNHTKTRWTQSADSLSLAVRIQMFLYDHNFLSIILLWAPSFKTQISKTLLSNYIEHTV